MSKLASFLGSTGLALLMTAAGLYFQADALALAGLVLLALSTLAFGISRLRGKPKEPVMSDDDSEWGDDNTLYGNVKPPKKMGSGNTIVGATDSNGNTIIPGGTSVGAGAGYDPSGVIIGARAGANLGKKPKGPGRDSP